MNVLFIDACMRREESRTLKMAEVFLDNLNKEYEVTHLDLSKGEYKPLYPASLKERNELLEKGELDHPRFDTAKQFRDADLMVIAAPFWDLSFPAALKIYIENVSVEGITFKTSEKGLVGNCKARALVYLVTRGGFYPDEKYDQGNAYLKAMADFFGIGEYYCVAAEGLDIVGYDADEILNKALEKTKALAQKF